MITILRATGACGFWIANGVVGALALTGGGSRLDILGACLLVPLWAIVYLLARAADDTSADRQSDA